MKGKAGWTSPEREQYHILFLYISSGKVAESSRDQYNTFCNLKWSSWCLLKGSDVRNGGL